MDRTLARLAQTLKWRRTDDFNGTDVEAVVARAERSLGRSDLADAVAERRQQAVLRLQPGYDHSYFFVSTFMEDHVSFHAEALYAD